MGKGQEMERRFDLMTAPNELFTDNSPVFGTPTYSELTKFTPIFLKFEHYIVHYKPRTIKMKFRMEQLTGLSLESSYDITI